MKINEGGKKMFFKVNNLKDLQEGMERLCEFLLQSDIPAESIFDSKLVVSELIGNVLKHSDGIASLHTEVKDGLINLKITSTKPYVMPEKSVCSDVFSEHGRGLFLVDSVCHKRIQTEDGEIIVTLAIKGSTT